MRDSERNAMLSGEILGEEIELSVKDLCAACEVSSKRLFELVEEGVVEPVGTDPAKWRFRAVSIRRIRRAERLERDLGVNVAGAALALDLLDELELLRARLSWFES